MSLSETRRGWLPLGQMLVEDGVISDEQLAAALDRQRRTRERLGQILVDMRLIDEDRLVEYLGAKFRTAAVERRALEDDLDPEVVRLVPEEVARQHGVIAFDRQGRQLVVATADPMNVVALDDLRRATGLDIELRLGAPSTIQAAIDRAYRRVASSQGMEEALRHDPAVTVSGAPADEAADLKQLRTQVDDPPVVKLVNYLLSRAAADGASDVHVEPHQTRTLARYRVDGLLFDLLEIPRALHLAVVSRLKIMARLDIAERRLPQDGSFSGRAHETEIDFRVSTLPTVFGEKVVLRLLAKQAVLEHWSLEGLGFDPDQLRAFLRGIQRPWGMVLLTGPTGSGKSTTLHTAIKLIKSPRKNIVTVEDPVEYRQPGIQQVQVKADIGFDFARALRSILRQDPDIIMIGEIRDQETAQIAVRAALTGHLVLSTLHANDAVSTIARLLNIGVEPFLVATGVRVTAAQRLVRRICADCKEAYAPTADEAAAFAPDPPPALLYRGRGCRRCRNLGYAGRMALFEVFPVTSEIRRLMLEGADLDRIRAHATRAGMRTLRQSGFRRAAAGETTLEEVLAVAAGED
jgi:type IV pilus assembly protein PilB